MPYILEWYRSNLLTTNQILRAEKEATLIYMCLSMSFSRKTLILEKLNITGEHHLYH